MSKTFTVAFANNDAKNVSFRLTASMKEHLARLEAEDTSDMDFTIDGIRSIKLSELLDMQDESAEFEEIVKYLKFLADPLGVAYQVNENLLYSSPIHQSSVMVMFGVVVSVGQPKPAQQNARWVRFDVKKWRSSVGYSALNLGGTIWVKQPQGCGYDFNNWRGKMARIIGKIHERWVIDVYQVITEDRSTYNAGGPRI